MISEKAKKVSPAITLQLGAMVKQMIADGESITNLTLGEPDFNTPDKAKQKGIEAINNNITKYDASSGNIELRKTISEKMKKDSGLDYTVDQIVVTNGAKQAILNTMLACLNPGDEVLIPTPCWVSYPEMAKIVGAVPVLVETKADNSFKMSVKDAEKYITPKTKMAIITNPSNPTGAVFNKDELFEICDYLTKKGIMILSDEIYEKMCFDFDFVSVASLSKEIYENTVVVNGLSKAGAMTGWRVGYCCSMPDVAKAVGAMQSNTTAHPCTVSQQAAIAALRDCEEDTEAMAQAYRKRRDMIVDFFKKWGKLSLVYPQGAFYTFIDISPMSDKIEYEGSFSAFFCKDILKKQKVAFVPGSGFYKENYIRMSYAASEEEIAEGLNKLKNYIENLI